MDGVHVGSSYQKEFASRKEGLTAKTPVPSTGREGFI
jgi:hypothetical protein